MGITVAETKVEYTGHLNIDQVMGLESTITRDGKEYRIYIGCWTSKSGSVSTAVFVETAPFDYPNWQGRVLLWYWQNMAPAFPEVMAAWKFVQAKFDDPTLDIDTLLQVKRAFRPGVLA